MKKFLLGLFLAVLTACSGMSSPESVDESLAMAEAQVTALRQSAADALLAGQITAVDATFVLQTTDTASQAIVAARGAEAAGDATTAAGKLAIATALLTKVTAYLAAHKGH